MPFQFIKIVQRVADMHRTDSDTLAGLGSALVSGLASVRGPCTAAALIRCGQNNTEVLTGTSDRTAGLHAEEQIAVTYAEKLPGPLTPSTPIQIPLVAMLVDIEPCRLAEDNKPRYVGHCCSELFGNGRIFQVGGVCVTVKFLPGFQQQTCPIFYFVDQPKRNVSADAQQWKAINTGDRVLQFKSMFEEPTDLIALGRGGQ
jgi:hypothetical protein